jgi:hypothetical protein
VTDELEPWERQPDETDRAWEAWLVYRDMGPTRSVAEAARKLKVSSTTINRWSTGHQWRERVKPYDRYVDKMAVAAFTERTSELMDQQLRLSKKLLDKLEANIDALPDGADPTMRWSTAYAAGTRAQREALNEIRPAKVQEEAAEDVVAVNVYALMEAIITSARAAKPE